MPMDQPGKHRVLQCGRACTLPVRKDAQSQVLMALQAGHPHTAEALFAMFCLGATVATLALPIETKGRALQVVS